MKAIGIFGGAFAPFHNGHLRLALEARERLALDQVRLVPTAQPVHRPKARISPLRRLEWLRLAVKPESALVADDCEIQRDGPSYTVDTLSQLATQYPRARRVLLMGADAFAHAALVLVDRGRVDHPVADVDCGAHRFGRLVVLDLPGTEAELRKLAAIVEGEGGVVFAHEFSFCTLTTRGP